MERILNLIERLERAALMVSRLLVYVAAASLVVLTALLVFSSLRRYVIGRPIGATEELVAALFVVMAFLPIAHAFLINRHIRLELLWSRLPLPWRDVATVVGQLFSLLVLVLCIGPTWNFAMFSFQIGAVAETANMPVGPWMLFIPAGLTLLATTVVVRLLRNIVMLMLGRSQPADMSAAHGGEGGW